jgi:hypothetical protein
MGYLNKQTVTVDAILTKKGRELLAQGQSAFQITQFAVADDEIDYGLYDPAHPLGTQYYGASIENMPIVEASPDETQNLRYKLVTLDRNIIGTINVIPTVSVGGIEAINLTAGRNEVITLRPTTTATQEFTFDGAQFGYTAVLFDRTAVTITSVPVPGGAATTPFTANSLSGTALVIQGSEFTIIPNEVDTVTETQLTITGNQSGATITIPITVNPASV